MIRGILFLEDGSIQQIGQLRTFAGIIKTLETALPELQKKEKERERAVLLETLSKEDLEDLLKEKNI